MNVENMINVIEKIPKASHPVIVEGNGNLLVVMAALVIAPVVEKGP